MGNIFKTKNNKVTVKLFIYLIFDIFLLLGLIKYSNNISYYIFNSFHKETPNCFDGIKNQNEKDIDCGGICPECKKSAIIWGSANAIKIGNNQYSLVAYINNSEPKIGVTLFRYSFDLYDVNNNIFRKIEGYNFIYPNQKKYIVENALNIDKEIKRVQFTSYDINLKEFEYNAIIPNISSSESKFEFKNNNTAEFSTVIYNKSENDFDNVEAVVIIRNKNNKIILAKAVDIGKIDYKDVRFLKIVWHNIYNISDQIASINTEFYIKPIN